MGVLWLLRFIVSIVPIVVHYGIDKMLRIFPHGTTKWQNMKTVHIGKGLVSLLTLCCRVLPEGLDLSCLNSGCNK